MRIARQGCCSMLRYVAIGYTERVPMVNKPQIEIYRDIQLPTRPPLRFRRRWHR